MLNHRMWLLVVRFSVRNVMYEDNLEDREADGKKKIKPTLENK